MKRLPEYCLQPLLEQYHYNPLTGEITYKIFAGSKAPGQPAGTTIRGQLHLRVQGSYWPALALVWPLHQGSLLDRGFMVPLDGDPLNLRWSNLAIAEAPFCRERHQGRRKSGPAWQRKCVKYRATTGMWEAFHKRQSLGEFHSKGEAAQAKLDAMRADASID